MRYYLFSSKVQIDRLNRATVYSVVGYDLDTREKVASVPMKRREGDRVVIEVDGEEYTFSTGGRWPEAKKPISLRLL